jgi:hypothetical protein
MNRVPCSSGQPGRDYHWENVMKNRVVLFLTLTAVLFVTCLLQAQQCSTHTTEGKYLVICDGYLPPGPGAPAVPAKGLVVVTGDKNGNFTGGGKVNVGGFILDQTVTGTEQINSDCTGTITYTQTINGQPAPPLDIQFVVSERGDRIDGLVVDPGTVFSCQLRRMQH